MTDRRQEVHDYYTAAARAVRDNPASSCCEPADTSGFGASQYEAINDRDVPDEALLASLGCGNPTAVAELAPGERVLDLGAGGGLDTILSARRVGPTGKVHGVDFVEEMLALARANVSVAGVDNVEFLKGRIEEIPLPRESVDVVISNCVINLSTDKPSVLAEALRVLVPGGRLGVTDVVAEDRLTPEDRAARGGYSECIAGALSEREYREMLEAAGFGDVEIRRTHEVADAMHSAIVRATKPASFGTVGAVASSPARGGSKPPALSPPAAHPASRHRHAADERSVTVDLEVRTVVHEGIGAVDRDAWERLARPAGFYLSYDWLLARQRRGGAAPLVVAAVSADGLVGALPCYLGASGSGNHRYDLEAIFGRSEHDGSWDPQLLGGGTAGYDGGALCDPALDADERRTVLAALLERFKALAAERGCRSAALAYLDRTALASLLPLVSGNAVPLVTGAAARMTVAWSNFDGYLASLSSSRRSNVRRDIRSFRSAGYEVVVERLETWIDDVAPLLARVQGHHGFDDSVSKAAGYLRLCADGGLDAQSVLFLARRENEVSGFALAYRYDGRLYMRVVGLDYEASHRHGVYFNTYFYAPVEYALANGIREIDFGIEAYEGKLRKGARLEVLWSLAWLPDQEEWARQDAVQRWNAAQQDSWRSAYGDLTGFPSSGEWEPPVVAAAADRG